MNQEILMDEPKQLLPVRDLEIRIVWLINLRWLAVIGLFLVLTGARYVLKMNLPFLMLYAGNLILILYNSLFFFYRDSKWGFKRAYFFANLQISLDLILLIYLIHFAGSYENPFIFFFIFHMVIASILLSNKAAYLQATLVVFLFGISTGGESLGLLPHYHLNGLIPAERCYLDLNYFIWIYVTFASTLYIIVYLTTTIVNKLRKRENELEAADKLKSQYVQSVAHDIKGSLSAIQSCLKVVLTGLTGPVSEKSGEMIARAERRSLSLLDFLNDLLALSKMRVSEKMEKKRVLLSELVKRVVEQLNPEIIEKGLIIIVGNTVSNSFIHANPLAIEQLFANILMNAVQYTPKGGKITLNFQEVKAGGFIRIVISDTGIGIPKEVLPTIFNDFFRAKEARELTKHGTGLGLAIAKHIVEEHGGEIRVESEEGRGCSFIFTLPKMINE